MKVLAIRGENLASLAGHFELDLVAEPLGGAGLFAVTGPTGAGKSTLLDALCLALYDRTPRLGGRGGTPVGYRHPRDADDLRSHDPRGILRRGAGSGFAEVDFVGRSGRRFRATWRVRRARGRPDGRLQPQTLELLDLEDDQPLGGHTKTETLAAIERAVGLDYDAFSRSVLLAQGEFAAFLRADAADRAALLERLSGSALYGQVSSLAHHRAREARDAVKLLEARAEAVTLLDEAERASLTQDRDAAEAETGAAREALAALEQRQRALRERDLAREEARAAEAARAAARRAHADAAELRAACTEAERLLPLRPLLDTADEFEAALAEAGETRERLRLEQSQAELSLERARAAASAADDVLDATRAANTELARAVAQARTLDAELAVARVELARARDAHTTRTRAHDAAQAALERARAAREAAAQAADDAAAAARAQAEDLELAQGRSRWEPPLRRFLDTAQARRRALAVRGERLQTVDALRGADAARVAELNAAEAALAVADDALASTPAIDPAALDALSSAHAQSRALVEASATAEEALARAETSRAGLAAASEALERLATQHLAAREALATERAEVAAARSAVRAIERTRDLAAQRADLEPEHPCPLCGATEHPYAHALPPLDRLLGEERERLQEAEARAAESATRLEALAGERAREAERRDAHRERLDEATRRHEAAAARWAASRQAPWPVDVDLPEDLHDPGTPTALEQLVLRLSEAEAARAAAAEAHASVRARHESARATRDAAAARARDARRSLEAGVTTLASVDTELAGLDEQLADAHAALEAEWPGALDQQALRADPGRFLDDARARADGALAAQQEATRTAELQAGAADRESEAEAALVEHAAALAALDASLTERQAELEALTARRATTLDGEAEAREAEAREAENQAQQRREDAQRALATAERDLTRASERCDLSARSAEEAERRARAARAQATAALSAGDLTPEAAARALAREPGWLTTTRAELERLERDLEARERTASLAADHLRRTESRLDEGLSGAALGAALEGARANARALAARWAQLVGRLDQDARARARQSDLAEELASTRAAARPWLELGELIGSHDGSKLRNFAQSLTLEALLGRANDHLRHLSPRYALERVSGQDLDLQVLDRDLGDEVRPLRSLSGGETFLVSLALALGLAGVRAADTRVESLFIDEGFGSLDPASQDLALEALDALQAQGLQVGVITHVRALAERVAARVDVRPVAQGESRLQVSSAHALV